MNSPPSSTTTTAWSTLTCAAPYLLSLLFFLFLLEQISYLRKKSHLPGPSFIILPFLGNALSLVANPTKFWDTQSNYAKSTPLGVSSNYIIGKYIVFIRNSELCHKIFSNVRPDAFHLVGHPFGKKLFGEHNMIYMFGQEHKDLRRCIAPNFTPKALSTYTCIQQHVIVKHIFSWLLLSSGSNPIPLRILVRDMNLETSQTVFAGRYLCQEERQRFNVDYTLFNVGVMKLPFDFPGCAFRNARLAVDRLVETLAVCAQKSKAKVQAGFEPECLVDFWMQDIVREEKEAAEEGRPAPRHSSDREIGGHLFDFLFAAQDASTSSLLWAISLLDSHPDVLSKVRNEVAGIWSPCPAVGGKEGGDHHGMESITADMMQEMRYTQAVAREVLRFRAPATLVPHIAGGDFALTEDYTIPKGTIVFPSVFESSFQGFTDPDRFDPDRFYSPDRQEDQVFRRNFLVFGAGAHQCVGQRYAMNHLVLFIALFVSLVDFKRHRSDGCDDIAYVPTICPKDDCMVFLSKRK